MDTIFIFFLYFLIFCLFVNPLGVTMTSGSYSFLQFYISYTYLIQSYTNSPPCSLHSLRLQFAAPITLASSTRSLATPIPPVPSSQPPSADFRFRLNHFIPSFTLKLPNPALLSSKSTIHLSSPPPGSSISLILSPTPLPSSPPSTHLSSTSSHDSISPPHNLHFLPSSASQNFPFPTSFPNLNLAIRTSILSQIHRYLLRYYFSVPPVVFRLPYRVFPVSLLPVSVVLSYLFIPFCFFPLLPSFPASLSFPLPLRHLFFYFPHFCQAFPPYFTPPPSSSHLLFIFPCSPLRPCPQFVPLRFLSYHIPWRSPIHPQ